MAKKAVKKTNQRELLQVMILSLLLGLAGGYGIGVIKSDDTKTNHSEVSTAMPSMHPPYEVPEEIAPTVDIEVVEDKKSGYNIKISTTNFTFAPESVNGENKLGEGHAHLYVDGVKVARVYGPYFHYNENFEGAREFRVELNANDHAVYSVNGVPIEARLSVSHDSSDPKHESDHSR